MFQTSIFRRIIFFCFSGEMEPTFHTAVTLKMYPDMGFSFFPVPLSPLTHLCLITTAKCFCLGLVITHTDRALGSAVLELQSFAEHVHILYQIPSMDTEQHASPSQLSPVLPELKDQKYLPDSLPSEFQFHSVNKATIWKAIIIFQWWLKESDHSHRCTFENWSCSHGRHLRSLVAVAMTPVLFDQSPHFHSSNPSRSCLGL